LSYLKTLNAIDNTEMSFYFQMWQTYWNMYKVRRRVLEGEHTL